MAAAAGYMHMDSIHSSSSAGSTMSLPPWHPAVPVDTHHQQQHQPAALQDAGVLIVAPSPSPPPPPPRPRNHHQQHLRPSAARRPSSTSRRRPRPSRKLPTTYITADPASFRRMVHQVTGADHLLPTPPTHGEATTLVCRPEPTRVVALAAAAGALPTLDTSAFLLRSGGGSGSGSGSSRRTTTGPAVSVRPQAPAVSEVEVGAGGSVGVGLDGAAYGGGGSDCGAGFPTLESWDALLY